MTEEKESNLDSIEHQIAELQKQKYLEQRKMKVLSQKEDLKRKLIELNQFLGNPKLTCQEREPIYKEIIQKQESLLFISGYYAKLLNGEY